jgi:hypothetical protein
MEPRLHLQSYREPLYYCHLGYDKWSLYLAEDLVGLFDPHLLDFAKAGIINPSLVVMIVITLVNNIVINNIAESRKRFNRYS